MPMPGLVRATSVGAQDEGGTMPCGWIQPNMKASPSTANSAIERIIRMVRNLTVRSVWPPSLIRLNMPAPRLIRISASKTKTMSLIIIKRYEIYTTLDGISLLDDGVQAV